MNKLKPWNKRKRTGGVKRKLLIEYAKVSMNELQRSNEVGIYKPESLTRSEGSAHIDYDQNIDDYNNGASNVYKQVSFTNSEGSGQTYFDQNIDTYNNEDFHELSCSKEKTSDSNRDELELSGTDEENEECIFIENIRFKDNIKEWAIKRNKMVADHFRRWQKDSVNVVLPIEKAERSLRCLSLPRIIKVSPKLIFRISYLQ